MSTVRYSYKDVPTIKKFSQSDAFIRGVMGPFRCLSGNTEFLTEQGWKRIDSYKQGDLVAQWDKNTNEIEFVKPDDYIISEVKELIEFRCSKNLLMQVSENHRIPHFDWKNEFVVKPASYIEKKPSRRSIPTTFLGHNKDSLGMSDDLIRFAVMMHADGHYPQRGKAQIEVHKDRKKERIRWLLNKLNIEFTEHTFPSNIERNAVRFSFKSPYVGKHFEEFWWKASRRELAVVLDEYKYWDGLFNDIKYSSSFSTTSKIDADFIQYAAHANGRRAAINKINYEDHPNWNTGYSVGIKKLNSRKNAASLSVDTVKIKRIPTIDNKAYCFTVPTGFFVARCEDTIFITGNSGKSSGAGVIEILKRGMQQQQGPDGIRHTRWIVVRNTYRQLGDTVIKTFFNWCPPSSWGDWKQQEHTYRITSLENTDIEILFRALDRPDHVANLLSLEVTGGWVNEAREVPWPIIDALQGRVGQYPPLNQGGPTWYGLILDTNPPDIDSEWYEFFEKKKHATIEIGGKLVPFAEIFRQPSGLSAEAENLANLVGGRNYYLNLMQGKTDEYIKVYIKGDYGFVIEGKPVFPEYNDRIHCDEDIYAADDLPVYVGLDFGLTPAASYSQVDEFGRWKVIAELVSKSMGIDRFSDQMIEFQGRHFPRNEFIYIGDPAGEKRAETDERTCFDILHAKGIPIEAGLQNPQIRQESIRKPLRQLVDGKPQFALHPRCIMLRKGFMGGYALRRLQVSGERYADVPEKNIYSHIQDSLQYVGTRLFGIGLITDRFARYEEQEYDDNDEYYGVNPTRSRVTGY